MYVNHTAYKFKILYYDVMNTWTSIKSTEQYGNRHLNVCRIDLGPAIPSSHCNSNTVAFCGWWW